MPEHTQPPAPTLDNTTFAVLCGGEGRRMGGKDKPLLNWRDQPMIDHVLSSVPSQLPKLLSANRNLEQYARRGKVIRDSQVQLPGRVKPGPLTGVLSLLQHCTTEWILIAPGDTPALPSQWWQVMLDVATANLHHVVAHDGQRQQHLHLLLHNSAQAALLDFLGASRFQVFLWLQELQPAIAQFDDAAAFRNINYPDELNNSV
ncbi:MAG: NTP transferase domain-containing protein [Pseudomonadota bacterium]